MQEYASTSQTPPSKSSCHNSKSFIKPPPAKPYMQEYASTSQLHLSKTSCHHSKACFKPPPSKTLHATVFLNFTASPLQDFWARFQVIFLTSPPQNLACKNILCFSKTSLGWGQSPHTVAFLVYIQHQSKEKKHADSCGFIRDSFPSNTFDLVAHRDMSFCR